METYDDFVRINYTDFDGWVEKYVESKILPLSKCSSLILSLRGCLTSLLEKNLKEALESQNIRQILLGGVSNDGEYKENSLAKIYKKVLGISINLKEWGAYCKGGLDPAESGIEFIFENTPFLNFAENLKEFTSKALYKVGIQPPLVDDIEVDEITKNPEKLLNIIKELYEYALNTSANYNYYALFILNTRCIPRFYIETAYPKLKEKFDEIVEILELEPKFIPQIRDEKNKKEYTLWVHRINGLADILYNIQRFIWDCFGKEEIKTIFDLITDPLDLWKIFKEKIKEKIPLPKELKVNTTTLQISEYNRALYFIIRSELIIKCFNAYSLRTTYAFFESDIPIPLLEFIKKLSPYLFFGFATLHIVDRVDYPEVMYNVKNFDCILKFTNFLG